MSTVQKHSIPPKKKSYISYNLYLGFVPHFQRYKFLKFMEILKIFVTCR